MANDNDRRTLENNGTLPYDQPSKADQDNQEVSQASTRGQSKRNPDSTTKSTLHKKGRYSADTTLISAEDRFVINDVILAIPPTTIRISRRNTQFKWHTLRSDHPAKVKSGHGEIQVALSVYFVGAKAINEGLRRLVVELEHSPFVYINNTYLRDNIVPNSSSNMAFTVLDFTIRTEPGLVDTLVLDLDLTWFNYLPFSRDFTYRQTWETIDEATQYRIVNGDLVDLKAGNDVESVLAKLKPTDLQSGSNYPYVDIFNSDLQTRQDLNNAKIPLQTRKSAVIKPTVPVKSPRESVPYRLFYNALYNKRALLSPKDGTTNRHGGSHPILEQSLLFKYHEYKQVQLPSNLQFAGSKQLKPGELSSVFTGNLSIIDGATLIMREKAARDLEVLAENFVERWNIKLPITSCFRTFEEQAALVASKPKLASKAGTSYHEVGLAIDIGTNSLTADQYVWLVLNAPTLANGGFLVNKNVRTRAGNDKEKLKQVHKDKVAEKWHFTHQGSDRSVADLLKHIYKGNDEHIPQDQVASTRGDYIKWLERELEGGWETVPKYPRVFRRPIEFSLAASDEIPSPPGNKMVMTSLAVSMNNLVASLPLVSHQYATHQYMGSTDKDIFMSFIAHGTQELKKLQFMSSVLEQNARVFRKVPESSTVTLGSNNILRFMQIDKAIIESVDTATIPGSPDIFNVNLKMTQWSPPAEQFLTTFATEDYLRQEIIERLVTQVSDPVVKYETRILQQNNKQRKFKIPIGSPTYKIIPKDVGSGLPMPGKEDYLIGKNGLIERLIDIIEELNNSLINEEVGRLRRIPVFRQYLMSLYGMEKLVFPNRFTFVLFRLARGGEIDTSAETVRAWDNIQRKGLVKAKESLDRLADEIMSSYFLDGAFFEDVRSHARVRGSIINGRPAYPDMKLPPHPLTGQPLDTEPDWYFWNDAEEGGEAVIGSALKDEGRKFAEDIYGSYSQINDASWYNSFYSSPNATPATKDKDKYTVQADGYVSNNEFDLDGKGKKVPKALKIGSSVTFKGDRATRLGNLGLFGNKKNDGSKRKKSNNPYKNVSFGRKGEGDSSLHDFGNTETGLQKTYDLAVANISNDQNTLRRAFPTFKIYFIEKETLIGNSNESNKRLRGFDDFYSYSAIKDIRIIRSRKVPADLAIFTMTNIAGLLDGKAFYSGKNIRDKDEDEVGPFNPEQVSEQSAGNPWEGIILKEGQKIQIRLGYSNNPNDLETVFNGQVVEVGPSETGDLMQVVCQSYGVELVQQVKGLELQPDNIGEAKNIGDTQELLSTLICEPEVVHFGRYAPNVQYNPNEIQVRTDVPSTIWWTPTTNTMNSIRTYLHENWHIHNQPQDDNIFAPEQNEFYDAWRKLLDFNLLDYYIIHTTIWDVFKEMELRHPGWISYPIPYEDRYTMFFGVASQHYWSRPAGIAEKEGLNELQKARDMQASWWQVWKSSWWKGTPDGPHAKTNLKDNNQYLLEAAKLAGNRFIPFRRYHMITSEHNIISNSITTDVKNSANAVAVEYRTTSDITEKGGYEKNMSILSVKADDNIEDKDTRVLNASFFNCEGRFMARNYSLGLLLRHMKDIYTGEICIVGDPRIKPHDICYVMDSYSDMFGQVGVEQVTHILSFETGFITKIVPDLVVTANEWYNAPLTDAIQKLAVDTYRATGLGHAGLGWNIGVATGAIELGLLGVAAAAAAPLTFTVGLGILGLGGGVGGFKFFQWTQERQPVHVTPLLLHGIPYIAGLDNFEQQNVWMYYKGKLTNWVTGEKDGDYNDFKNNLGLAYSTARNNAPHALKDIWIKWWS